MSATPADQPPRPEAEEFVIPTRREFLEALDPDNAALVNTRQALAANDVDEAGRRFIRHFREREMVSPLMPTWSTVPRDPDAVHEIAKDCLRGRLHDGYNVYEIPPEGIDWVDCPLFCLPRFPYFSRVVPAFHHSGDVRYARFIVDHSLEYMRAYPIEWFVGKHSNEGMRNHYLVGPPTWWCLCPNRLEQLARAMPLLRQCDAVSDEELLLILHRMLQEIRYLMTQTPHWVSQRHNVVAFTIRVVGILCCVMADFAEARTWLRRDAEWLADYLDHGFYPDGLYKELTLGYSSSCVSQVSRVGYVLREESAIAARRDLLLAANAAMVGIVKPTGSIPSFGDAHGRPLGVVVFPPMIEWLNEPWLTAMIAKRELWSGDEDAGTYQRANRVTVDDDEAAWPEVEIGDGAVPPFTEWPPPDTPAWGGYYAMRSDWSRQANYMMIDGGPWGTTHQHMDKLSFVVCSQGVDFITDPGNTLYANNEPDARISMLNAGFMHNTITVDGVDEYAREWSEFATEEPLANRWETGENWTLFVGEYDFAPLKPVRWQRRVLFVDGAYWILQDVLTGEQASVEVEQNFQFEPTIGVELAGDVAEATAPGGQRLLLAPLGGGLEPTIVVGDETSRPTYSTAYNVCSGEPEDFGHGRGWISRVQNKIIPAPAVTYSGAVSLPAPITVAILPAPSDGPTVRAADIVAASDGEETRWALPTRNGPLALTTSVARFDVESASPKS